MVRIGRGAFFSRAGSGQRFGLAAFGAGLLLLAVSVWPSAPEAAAQIPTRPSQPLDAAVRAGDEARIRALILKDVGAADDLFLRYLAQELEPSSASGPGQTLALARRLAESFLGLFELDLELGVLDFWVNLDLTRQERLLAVLRDHFRLFKEERSLDDHPLMPIGWQERLAGQFKALAERYRALDFRRGELAAWLRVGQLEPDQAEKVWDLAKAARDPVGEARAAYYFGVWAGEGGGKAAEHAVEAATRLRLPNLRQLALTRLAWRALSRNDFEGHIGYFRKAQAVMETIPAGQDMVGRWSRRRYAGRAWFHMVLWRAGELNARPEFKGEFDKGLTIARNSGGREGELAYLIAAIPRFIEPGLFEDVAARADTLARRMGDKAWLVRVLQAKVDAWTGTRESKAAIAAATEGLDLLRRMAEKAHLAKGLGQRAALLAQASRFEEAARDYRESIALFDELGFEDQSFTTAYDAGYYCRPKPALSEEFYGLALATAEKKGGGERVVRVLNDRGQGRLSYSPVMGVADLQAALAETEKANLEAGRPAEDLGLMGRVGQALRRVGRFGEAVDVQERRATIARERNDVGAEADACFWLNQIEATDLGSIDGAAAMARRYQALIDRPDPPPGINEWNRLAIVFSSIGQQGRALAYWRQALQQAETPGRKEFRRMVHSNLAGAYLKIGDYDAAQSELVKERDLIEATFEAYRGQADLQKAQWFNKSALVHTLAGNPDRAVADAIEAVRLEAGAGAGTESADYYSYFTPGDALALAGRTAEAMAFYETRRDRAREVHSAYGEREALEHLGRLQLQAGDVARARLTLVAAVEAARNPPLPETGGLADSLLALAELEIAAGDAGRAGEILAEAQPAANEFDRHQVWRIERAAALAAAAGGKPEAASAHFERAEEALEKAGERFRPEEFRVRFGIDRLQIYDEHALALAGLAIASSRRADVEKALRVVERRRLQALWDLQATGWVRLEPEAVPEQLQRVREAEVDLAARQNVLRAQFALAPEKRDPALIDRVRGDLERAHTEHSRLLASLAQGTYRYSAPEALAQDLASELRKRLRPGQALVEYLIGDRTSYAFVLTPSALELQPLAVGRAELRRQVRGLLQPFYGLRDGGLDLTRLGFDYEIALALYRQLWAPLEALLGGARRIVLVPDDFLSYLPFEALVTRLPEAGVRSDVLFAEAETASFILGRYSLSYLTAAAHLAVTGEASIRRGSRPTLLAMADPMAATEPSAAKAPLDRTLRSAGLGQAFSALPRTAEEVRRIGALFDKGDITLLTGPAATESRYKALSGNYDLLHLSTHAVAVDERPLYSMLVLAPESGSSEDGALQAYEILRFPLKAKLVVLSACETALGPMGRGEGLVGLVAAFRQAGARSVVATQWSIDDSAVETMSAFYRGLRAGRGSAEALRAAKLTSMKSRIRFGSTEVSLAHPFFWAPFVLIGGAD
jgi:CHAT domain-containing protein